MPPPCALARESMMRPNRTGSVNWAAANDTLAIARTQAELDLGAEQAKHAAVKLKNRHGGVCAVEKCRAMRCATPKMQAFSANLPLRLASLRALHGGTLPGQDR